MKGIFLIVLIHSFASAEDDYLQELEAAAHSAPTVAEMRSRPDIKLQGIEKKIIVYDEKIRQAFEELLYRRYRGSYEIYQQLSEEDKAEIIAAYENRLPMRRIRRMIISRRMYH